MDSPPAINGQISHDIDMKIAKTSLRTPVPKAVARTLLMNGSQKKFLPRQIMALNDAKAALRKRKRRKLHRFTQDQIDKLEGHYQSGDYWPSRDTRDRFAKQFGVPQRKVQVWFQNRRAKTNDTKNSVRYRGLIQYLTSGGNDSEIKPHDDGPTPPPEDAKKFRIPTDAQIALVDGIEGAYFLTPIQGTGAKPLEATKTDGVIRLSRPRDTEEKENQLHLLSNLLDSAKSFPPPPSVSVGTCVKLESDSRNGETVYSDLRKDPNNPYSIQPPDCDPSFSRSRFPSPPPRNGAHQIFGMGYFSQIQAPVNRRYVQSDHSDGEYCSDVDNEMGSPMSHSTLAKATPPPPLMRPSEVQNNNEAMD